MNGEMIFSEKSVDYINGLGNGKYEEIREHFDVYPIIEQEADSDVRRARVMNRVGEMIFKKGYNGLSRLSIDSDEVIQDNGDGTFSIRENTFVYRVRGSLIRRIA